MEVALCAFVADDIFDARVRNVFLGSGGEILCELVDLKHRKCQPELVVWEGQRVVDLFLFVSVRFFDIVVEGEEAIEIHTCGAGLCKRNVSVECTRLQTRNRGAGTFLCLLLLSALVKALMVCEERGRRWPERGTGAAALGVSN